MKIESFAKGSTRIIGGKIPLNVCVAGHRNLIPEEMPAIEREVRNFFLDLQRKYSATPVRCYSALAIGADQLVANVAVELDIELIAVLPAPLEVYLEHFFVDGTFGDFDRLYALASTAIVLPLPPGVVAECFGDENCRAEQFAFLGNFLADRSLILLALYDGVDKQRRGGTSWITERKKQGRQQVGVQRFDPPETGFVCQVWVRRLSDPLRKSTVHISPEVHLCEHVSHYEGAFAEIDRFNARVAALPGTTEPGTWRTSRSVNASNTFEAADALAIIEKRELQRARYLLFACAVTMFCAYLLYANYEALRQVVALYVFAQVSGALLWLRLRSKNTFRRYLSYRSFAEALRVQIAWSDSGLKSQVVDHFLRKHRVDLRWIRLALRTVAGDEQLLRGAMYSPVQEQSSQKVLDASAVKAQWIDRTLKHYQTTARKWRNNTRVAKTAAAALYIAGIGSGVASLLVFAGPSAVAPNLEQTLILCMGAFPASAALLLGFANNQGWEEDAGYNEHMAEVFARCVALWGTVSPSELVKIVGKEALRHNGDWLSAHASRKLTSPSL